MLKTIDVYKRYMTTRGKHLDNIRNLIQLAGYSGKNEIYYDLTYEFANLSNGECEIIRDMYVSYFNKKIDNNSIFSADELYPHRIIIKW